MEVVASCALPQKRAMGEIANSIRTILTHKTIAYSKIRVVAYYKGVGIGWSNI